MGKEEEEWGEEKGLGGNGESMVRIQSGLKLIVNVEG